MFNSIQWINFTVYLIIIIFDPGNWQNNSLEIDKLPHASIFLNGWLYLTNRDGGGDIIEDLGCIELADLRFYYWSSNSHISWDIISMDPGAFDLEFKQLFRPSRSNMCGASLCNHSNILLINGKLLIYPQLDRRNQTSTLSLNTPGNSLIACKSYRMRQQQVNSFSFTFTSIFETIECFTWW